MIINIGKAENSPQSKNYFVLYFVLKHISKPSNFKIYRNKTWF